MCSGAKNLVKFHDTRRTNVTNMDGLELQEKDMMRVSGHQTETLSRRYNQFKQSAERVRIAKNNSARAWRCQTHDERSWLQPPLMVIGGRS
jgi:hypothetical protein